MSMYKKTYTYIQCIIIISCRPTLRAPSVGLCLLTVGLPRESSKQKIKHHIDIIVLLLGYCNNYRHYNGAEYYCKLELCKFHVLLHMQLRELDDESKSSNKKLYSLDMWHTAALYPAGGTR